MFDEVIATGASGVGRKLQTSPVHSLCKYWLDILGQRVLGAGVINMNKVSELPCLRWAYYQTDNSYSIIADGSGIVHKLALRRMASRKCGSMGSR